MSNAALITLLRGLAAFLIAMPGTLQLVPDLALSPAANAVLLVAALAGATLMSQLPPAGAAPKVNPDKLTSAQTKQVADELERRMKRTPAPDAEPHG